MLPRRGVVRICPSWRCHGPVHPTTRRLYSDVQPNIQPTIQSSTAIHPSPLESSSKRLALYNTLEKLRAVSHAELEGRFNLALEDLKEWEAPFRIAILGMGNTSRPGRLIQLLSSSKKENSEWAQKLSGVIHPGHGIIVTPGQDATYKQSNLTPMAEITLPQASKLLSSKFTMVVLNLDPSRGPFAALEPSIPLGPRKGNLYYPVHRSIMIVEDLQGLLDGSISALLESLDQDLRVIVTVDPQTIRAAGNILDTNDRQRFVSLDLAEAAISSDEKDSIAWSESRIEDAVPLLSPGKNNESNEFDVLSEHVYSHIQSLLDTPLESLPSNPQAEDVGPKQPPSNLNTALSTWFKAATDELGRDLKISSTPNAAIPNQPNGYGRLTWWNLPRYANNINEICTTVIKNDFLVNAERQSCWFGGRLVGEGFTVPPLSTSDFTLLRDVKQLPTAPSQSVKAESTIPLTPNTLMNSLSSKHYIYPYHISLAKSHIISNLNAPLQAEAKRLRLNFDTNFLLSGATAILLDLSQFSTYTSLSVFCLGIVVAARRLQVNWEKSQRKWEDSVKEVGRISILDVQHWVKKVLEGERQPNFEEIEKWKELVRSREDVVELRRQAKGLLEELRLK